MNEPLKITFENPAWARQRGYLALNQRYARYGLLPGSMAGRTVIICGAGPSLATEFDATWDRWGADEVWGCNSALPWLVANQKPVTHGVAVAGEESLLDDWKTFPNVLYYVSSGVSPTVIRLLHSRHRKMAFFHLLLGIFRDEEEELAWYGNHYPASIMVRGGGINVTNRAVALALDMGFAQVIVVGADCCCAISEDPMPNPPMPVSDEEANAVHWEWVRRQTMYADGRDPVSAFGRSPMQEGWICGRRFVSRPDMLISAIGLVEMKQRHPSRLQIVGDTLPNWLLQTPEEEWRAVMPVINEDGAMVNIGRKLSPVLTST